MLDDDLVERIKDQSRSRGSSFRDTLNQLLRTALLNDSSKRGQRTLTIAPRHMGYRQGLNHGSVEALIEFGEGQLHR